MIYMTKFKGLIFDLDGTLSDSVAMILRSSQSVHEKMGLPWDKAAAESFIGKPLYETAAAFAPGREDEYVKTFGEFNMLYMPKMIKPFPGTPSLLATLQQRGVELAIVTSRLQWGADWSAEILGIESYFTAILGVEATEKHKPNPEPALLALEKLGVKAEDAAFIGDAAVDIACGKAAGMKTIGVGWGVLGDKLKDAEPDYFVPTVNALSHLLLLDEELQS
jgi:pyrophosphatase PpaX